MTLDEAIVILECARPYSSMGCGESDEEIEEAMTMAIKALGQEPILDKIRAELEELDEYYDNDYFSGNRDAMYKCNEVLQIIDKYKRESEVEK